jgi:hypothetical protein
MANEIGVTAKLAYSNPTAGIAINPPAILSPTTINFSITGKNYSQGSMSVPTTSGGTAIPVSNLANVGWAMFVNLDGTNYVEIMSAVSGTVLIQLQPGESALFRFAPTITAPAFIAHTAACEVQWLILEI